MFEILKNTLGGRKDGEGGGGERMDEGKGGMRGRQRREGKG